MSFKINKESFSWKEKLTASEAKILLEIASQKTSKDIAALFFISEKTVEAHRSNIIKKQGIPNERNALFMWCIKNITTDSI